MNEKFDLYIIDENSKSVESLLRILSNYRLLNIKIFANPLFAIKELKTNPAQCVLVNFDMPIMDGKDFIIKMSELFLFTHSSFVLMTDRPLDGSEIVQLHTLGYSDIIEKPFDKEKINRALSEILISSSHYIKKAA